MSLQNKRKRYHFDPRAQRVETYQRIAANSQRAVSLLF